MEDYNAYVDVDVHKDTIAVAVAYTGRSKAEPRGFIPDPLLSFPPLARMCYFQLLKDVEHRHEAKIPG
jgi:hypothetical protein